MSATLAAQLYGELTDDERMNLLDGDIYYWAGTLDIVRHGYNIAPYVMGGLNRLGIPGIRFVDGPRGCVSGAWHRIPGVHGTRRDMGTRLWRNASASIGEEVREQEATFSVAYASIFRGIPLGAAFRRLIPTNRCCWDRWVRRWTRGVRRHAMALCQAIFACNSMETRVSRST